MIKSDRLIFEQPSPEHASFIFRLLNDPDWIKYVGDRNIKTNQDAITFIEERLLALFREWGFGLWIVRQTSDKTPLGICGLVKRESLPDPDLGFAFLPEYRRQGFAREASTAVIDFASREKNLKRLLAITVSYNKPSKNLLTDLGFIFQKNIELSDDDEQLELYATDL